MDGINLNVGGINLNLGGVHLTFLFIYVFICTTVIPPIFEWVNMTEGWRLQLALEVRYETQ